MQDSLALQVLLGDVEDLRISLLEWFEINGRHWIPWKLKEDGKMPHSGEILSVYGIWIAEVMLQQTQLKVVLPYWAKWMTTFPSLEVLAKADEQEVLLHWQGLGYYSRAKRLHSAAKILFDVSKVNKNLLDEELFWPRHLDQWIQLPGIGRSTAGSIISSAFDLPVPLLDGNIKRIFSRLIASSIPPNKDELRLWSLSWELLDTKSPRKFNQALMDLGATVCTPHQPNCVICPIKACCMAFSFYHPRDFPVKIVKRSIPSYVIGIGIVINNVGEVLIAQRLQDQSMGGMWEFPGGKQEKGESIEETIARELKEELAIDIKVGQKLIELDHAFSHKKFHFIVHICKLISGDPQPLASQQFKWVMPHELQNYPFPVANTCMISELHKYVTSFKMGTKK